MPPRPLRFAVVTGSDLESGTVVSYLLRTTAIRIEAIYLDTMQAVRRRAPAEPEPRWFRDWGAFRRHLGLCRAMPRHYFFKALGRLAGVSELRALSWLERVSPRLLSWAAGTALPPGGGKRPL